MCLVIGLHLVHCWRCGHQIRLAAKGLYITHPWVTHSGRCVKPQYKRTERAEAAESLLLLSKSAETVDVAKALLLLTVPISEMKAAKTLLQLAGKHRRE